MADILVVCTGNVCRSPIAEAALRARFTARLGDRAPTVASAGTHGWVGSGATPEAVDAARELGIDVAGHHGSLLDADRAGEAVLLIGLTTAHREAIRRLVPRKDGRRVFTLKELARLAEALPPRDPEGFDLRQAVDDLASLRERGTNRAPADEDIVDPYGEPPALYRAVAWEIDVTVDRLLRALLGP